MLFSVLMSLYAKERPDFLRQSLDSIFSQTIAPTEVVIVEDGPLTTDLYSVLDEFELNHAEIKRVALKENGGLGNALNEGLKYCSHEIVARMDTDDIALPNRFESQIDIFNTYPDVQVVSCWIDEFEGNPMNIVSTRKIPEFPFEIYKYGKKRCPINHPASVFRKSAILFAGGYRHFPLFEDYYLWVRLLLNGAKFYNIQESLLLFRSSSDVFKRRGGLKHALEEVKFQNHIRAIGYINMLQMVVNITIRFTTRIVPNSLRGFIYKKLRR